MNQFSIVEMDPAAVNQLQRIFKRWRTWYRLRRLVAWAVQGLIFGLAFGFGLALIGLFMLDLPQQEFLTMSLGTALLICVIAGAVGFAWTAPTRQVSRFFDRSFTLQDRSSTAFELISQGMPTDQVIPEVVHRQIRDTLDYSQDIHPRAVFFLNVNRQQILVIAILAIGIGSTFFWGKDLFQAAIEKQQVQQAIQQEIAQIETIRQQIEEDKRLSPSDKDALLQELNRAIQGLEKAENKEQAVAVLSSTEEQLQALSDPQAQRQAEGLKNAGTRLLQSEKAPGETSPLQSFAQNLTKGDYLAAANDLRDLNLDSLTADQLQKLADQLEAAADALADSNSQLSNELRAAAQEIRNGDLQAAQQALSQATQTLSLAAQQIAQSQLAQQASNQVSQGQDRLIQSGQNALGQPTQNASNAGSQSGTGSGQTQGSGSASSGSEGSGAGQGSSSGQEGQGPEAGDNPIGQNNQPGDGGLTTYEPIYAPQRLGGIGNQEVTLPGSQTPGDQIIGQEGLAPGEAGVSRVPYVDVLPNYTNAVRQAIDSGLVPVTLRSLVKKYFSSLEP